MNKAFSIENLFDELKDNIELDDDIDALFKILKEILKRNPKKGIEDWLYLMSKYDFFKIQRDMNVYPLTNTFLLEIAKKRTLIFALKLINDLPISNQKIIQKHFLNIYHSQSGLNQYFKEVAFKKEQTELLSEIKYVLRDKLKKEKLFFDETDFLKKIILIGLEQPQPNINFLLELAELPKAKKERAILKTLLIDYIFK